jgi:PAS domain S-box-containing protein
VLELASLYGFEETDLRIINRIVPQLAIGINTIRSGLVQKALLVERNRLFNLSLDMICISGFDGYFKQLNPAWEKNLGWSSDELMAIPFLDIVHPEDREATARAAQGLVAGQALNNFENRYRCADGSYIWISLNSYPLVEEELIFSMARDVTVQKKLEQEISERSTQVETANFELHTINEESQTLNESLQILNEQLKVQQIENIESNRRLAEVSQTKSDFLANMSHELRTPLNSVIGFSEVLQDQMFGQINQKQQEYVSNILTSGKHLLSLINDILDLSKVESGKMVLEMGDFSLRESLDASLMMLKEKALKAGIELNLELAPQADIRIVADQRKIKQILFNLLSNAVKFTPAGGTICVSAVRDGDFIEITVADSGMGIRPEDISKLFKAFTQLESVYTKGFEGTGLGLALTRQLVELHGGRVWVKSDFGAGSRFSFTLPLAPAVIVSSPTGPQAADSTATVLLIEDDPLTLSSIGRALQSKGHVTLLAANGEEGVRIAQRELPDLIILDLVMPGMSGFEVIKQLHNLKATAGIPVLILTEMDLSGADRSRLTGKVWRIEEKRSLSTQELNSLVERAVESNKRTR